MSFIEVNNISKRFKTVKRDIGFFNTFKSLFIRKYSFVNALDNINFKINKGELVGYIGPNGAGKSTTIKILSGVLHPSDGNVLINGYVPQKHRRQNAMNIGVVFGQRSQLYWDLPMMDTFQLYQKMYKIEINRFKKNVEFYTDLLDMKEFIYKPIRTLSLGQKMRANIAVSLLHDPEILYLDEPTIGLDVVAKNNIRKFIRKLNHEKKTTVMLTTHDMDDIEEICDRIIMIDHGTILYDGQLESFKDKYSSGHMLIIDFADKVANNFKKEFSVIKEKNNKKWIVFKKSQICTGEAMSYFVKNFSISDISLKEPDIEEIVRHIYEKRNKLLKK